MPKVYTMIMMVMAGYGAKKLGCGGPRYAPVLQV